MKTTLNIGQIMRYIDETFHINVDVYRSYTNLLDWLDKTQESTPNLKICEAISEIFDAIGFNKADLANLIKSGAIILCSNATGGDWTMLTYDEADADDKDSLLNILACAVQKDTLQFTKTPFELYAISAVMADMNLNYDQAASIVDGIMAHRLDLTQKQNFSELLKEITWYCELYKSVLKGEVLYHAQ